MILGTFGRLPNMDATECAAELAAHGWCCMSTRTLQPTFVVTQSLRERFYSRVDVDERGCWIWSGPRNEFGYGCTSLIGFKVKNAHVVSWRIEHGGVGVPLGHVVMHLCDVPACVNPEHLKAGTQSENMLHAAKNGRLSRSRQRGSDRHNAVLNDDLVRQIRSLSDRGAASAAAIARTLGFAPRTVRDVVARRSWKHVDAESAPVPQLQEAR